jgi:hypothetical protein
MCRIIAANVVDRQAGRPERESAKLGWPISCTGVPQRLAFPPLEIPEALITSDMQEEKRRQQNERMWEEEGEEGKDEKVERRDGEEAGLPAGRETGFQAEGRERRPARVRQTRGSAKGPGHVILSAGRHDAGWGLKLIPLWKCPIVFPFFFFSLFFSADSEIRKMGIEPLCRLRLEQVSFMVSFGTRGETVARLGKMKRERLILPYRAYCITVCAWSLREAVWPLRQPRVTWGAIARQAVHKI